MTTGATEVKQDEPLTGEAVDQQVDAFNDAFAEASAPADAGKADEPKADTAQATSDEDEGAAAAASDAAQKAAKTDSQGQAGEVKAADEPGDDKAAAAEAGAGKPAKAATPEASAAKQEPSQGGDFEQKYKTLQGKYNAERTRDQNTIRELQRQVEDAKKPGQQATTKEGETAELDEDDEAVLAEVRKEAPTLAKAIDVMLKKQEQRIRAEIGQQIAPTTARVEEQARNEHLTTIRGAHKDFDALMESGEVHEWVETLPSYLKAGFQQVLAKGTADDVIDMVTRYKGAAGKAQDTAQQQQQQQQPTNPIKAKREKQLADSEAVRTRKPSSSVASKQIAAEDDFEGAFNEAINAR